MEFKYYTESSGTFEIDDFENYIKTNFDYDLTKENINDLLKDIEENPFHFEGGQLISMLEDGEYEDELTYGASIWDDINERITDILK